MKKLILSLLILAFAGGSAKSQELFTGKVTYRHYLQNPDPSDVTFASITVDFLASAKVERMEYSGPLQLSYPQVSITTDTTKYQSYNTSPNIFFCWSQPIPGIDKMDLIPTNETATIAGYTCKKSVMVTQASNGNTLVSYFWLAESLAIRQPRFDAAPMLTRCPLKIVDIVEDCNGHIVNTKTREAVAVEAISPATNPLTLLAGKTIKPASQAAISAAAGATNVTLKP